TAADPRGQRPKRPRRRSAQKRPYEPGDCRYQCRAKQARVVATEPSIVLPQTDVEERARRDRRVELAVARHGEIAGLGGSRRVAASPRLQEEREAAAEPVKRLGEERELLSTMRDPVGEEQDVPCLLLDDRLKDRDQPRRKEARFPGEVKEAEGEER